MVFGLSSPCSGTGARSCQLREGWSGWLRRRIWVRRKDSLRLMIVSVLAMLAEAIRDYFRGVG
jgi:hypothetical protein